MADFYKGMDLSSLPQGIAEGMKVKDFDGTRIAPLALAKKYGVNAVRLRIWNQPENVPEAKGYCNLPHTVNMAKEIKRYEMHFMLDFYYSDFWADPGNQTKPLAWKELHGQALEEAVYTYTREVLLQLEKEDVLPDIVQIGNEIRSGMLFPDGAVPDYQTMAGLINAGIRGARSVADKERLKVMIHLDQGGRYQFLKDWFDQALEQGLMDFDIIGLSYYPFWHGTFMDLKETAQRLIQDFHKPIMVVETAHAWRKSSMGFIDEEQEKIAGFPATPEGQKQVVDIVMNIVASLPEEMGQGVYYWEPLCVPDGQSSWNESMGILAEDGTVMEAVKSFLFTREQACPNKIAKIYQPKVITCAKAAFAKIKQRLPQQVQILRYNGTTYMENVQWEPLPNKLTLGEMKLNGKLVDYNGQQEYEVTLPIKIVEHMEKRINLAVNPQWDNDFEGWNMHKSSDTVAVERAVDAERFHDITIEQTVLDYILTITSPMNFRFTLSQTISLKEAGVYQCRILCRGVDATGVDVRIFMETPKQYQDIMIHPADEEWTAYEMDEIHCDKGELTFGIRIIAPPIFVKIKEIRLEKVR